LKLKNQVIRTFRTPIFSSLPGYFFLESQFLKKLGFLGILFLGFPGFVWAQTFPSPYDFNTYSRIDDTLYSTHYKIHTSLKPYLMQDSLVQKALDTLQSPRFKGNMNNFLIRKLYNEHLVEFGKGDYSFYLDFYPDFTLGKEFPIGRTLFTNSRGFQLGGKIGKQVYFQTNYFTDQAKFPIYLTQFIQSHNIVPGQGYIKPYGKDGFDYANAEGFISYTPSKYFTFQLGNGKNFIGDGYRSLILSDNSFSYPYFKIITTVGPFRYLNMWTQMTDIHDIPFNDSIAYPKKFGIFQYLDWTIGHHITLGFFQNIMMEPRGTEMNYWNPLIFLIPVQFSIGSPDKATLGFTGNYKFLNHYDLYGQLIINEFTISKVFGDPGYWANKQAFQLGIKAFDFLGIPHLNILLEHNQVRPFTYSAGSILKNYAHYNQALGDPFGANFKETLGIFQYSIGRFSFREEILYCFYGEEDPSNPNISYGHDLYKPYTERASNEGYFIGAGIPTHLWFNDLKASYTLNYKNNLRLEMGLTNRSLSSSNTNNSTSILTLGIKGSFRNFYYDF